MHYYAGWATKIVGQTIPVNGPYFNYTRHEAVELGKAEAACLVPTGIRRRPQEGPHFEGLWLMTKE